MATLAEIKADRHKWKKITGTGTAPYNPARYELKEKYKKEQRKKLKKTTTPTITKRVDKPTTTKRVDKPTTTTTTKTDTVTPIRKRLSSAVDRAAAGKRAVAKVYSRATEKAAATARGKAARERLYSGAKKGSDPKEVARRIDLRKEDAIREAARKRERAPVTIKTLKPLARQVYDKPIGPPPPPLHELLVEKTGGKVSRRKGGTVSRTEGGKVWNGNEAVAEGYD